VFFHEEIFPYNLPEYNFINYDNAPVIPNSSLAIFMAPTSSVFYSTHNTSISSLSPTNITSTSYTTSSLTPTSSPTSSPSNTVTAHNSPIPTTIHNVMLSPSWLQAMHDEYVAFLNNQT